LGSIQAASIAERLFAMKKPLPKLQSDQEAEQFVAKSDLTEYDLAGVQVVRFELQPKSERVNMRLPRPLLDAVKASAARAGYPLTPVAVALRSVFTGRDSIGANIGVPLLPPSPCGLWLRSRRRRGRGGQRQWLQTRARTRATNELC